MSVKPIGLGTHPEKLKNLKNYQFLPAGRQVQ